MKSLDLFEDSTLACWVISGKSDPDSLPDFPHLSSKGDCSNFSNAQEAEGCSHMRIVLCPVLRENTFQEPVFKLLWELSRSSG